MLAQILSPLSKSNQIQLFCYEEVITMLTNKLTIDLFGLAHAKSQEEKFEEIKSKTRT